MHFNPREQWASTEAGRKQLLDALMTNSFEMDVGIGDHDPATLPRRFLPPGTYSDLYRLYQAECFAQQQPIASATTFFRVLRQSGWKRKIKFRAESTHAQCWVCHKLKSGVRNARGINDHAASCDRYMRHLGGVFADRQVYAQLKNRARQQRDCLVCIVDSMDKSKFRLPRFAAGRTPKPLETKRRPELEFTACLMHGHAVMVFVTDSEQATGSDWSLEVLSLSLDKTFARCQQNNVPWPDHLRIFTDNTPKDAWTSLQTVHLCMFLQPQQPPCPFPSK